MMRTGPRLRSIVTLPASPLIGAAHLRDALGVSKAVLWNWRRGAGFPLSYREGRERWTVTDAVAAWLREHGTVVRVR